MDSASPESDPGEQPLTHACSHCGEQVDCAATAGPIAQCPKCGSQFFVNSTQDHDDQSDPDTSVEQANATQEEELSALRIKQMSALRRTAYRTRSYFIVGVICCAAVAINLVWNTADELRKRHHFTVYAGLYICLAIASAIGAWRFWGRTIQIHRDIQASIRAREREELEISKLERDFSALSDGSHQAKNLEQIYDPHESRGG